MRASYSSLSPKPAEKATSTSYARSALILFAATAFGACIGFAYVHSTSTLGVGVGSTFRSFVPSQGSQTRQPRSAVLASRQQQAAIEKFKQTGLRPGQKQRDSSPALRTGRSVCAETVTLDVKGFDGSVVGQGSLALKVARPESAKGLVHRYLMYAQNSLRAGTASTKTRGEVRGGGKKPYQQKKTGNARQGSKRSPLRPGGGVIFGPKPRDWSVDMNKKERRIAMATALQSATPDLVVVENLDGKFEDVKTKNMAAFLDRIGVKPADEKVLLVVEGHNKRNALLSARNIDKLKINKPTSLRIIDVLGADKIVVEKGALETMQDLYGPQATKSEEEPVAVAEEPVAEQDPPATEE